VSPGLHFPRPITGRHVLIALLVFFGVIFAVNGVFLYISLRTHPGVSTEDAYRKGLQFNRELEERDRQEALGWAAEVAHRDGVATVRLTGAGGAALTGVSVVLEARRPASDAEDRTLAVAETAPGVFRATGPALAPGRWVLHCRLSDAAGHSFRSETEILVKAPGK
jgi:nitrogen fixation protein FixH